ncbi:MAG: type I-C CRISPR-associated protein Cas7/Csd2 [Eubacteriales bacterium]
MAVLKNKIDFALIFTAKNANPNGDPLGGNRPRTTSDGLGEVSDVCLKRKIRNRLQESGNEIFVQMEIERKDEYGSLSERFRATFKDKLSNLAKVEKGKQIDKIKLKEEIATAACQKWMDVRAFGQVFAIPKSESKNDGNDDEKSVSIGVRGPVSIQSAFSCEPIIIESLQITKSVNGKPPKNDVGQKSPDTMGMKHRVSNAVYVTYGSISPQLAEKTGFSEEDAAAIKNAIVSLFEGDESSARPSGSMQVLKLVWFVHNSKSGQYSSAKVHNSVKVSRDGIVNIEALAELTPEILEG